MIRTKFLFLEKISGAVIFNDDPFFLNKHSQSHRQATDLEARRSHELNGCKLTVGHYHYGEAKCFFCGKKHYVYGVKP